MGRMHAIAARSLVVALAVAALGCNGRLERQSADAAGDSRSRAEVAAPAADESEYGTLDAEGFSSEAERTRAMESQASDLRQQYEDAMANAANDEDRIRAYQEFEQGRQELNEMSEGDLGDGEDAFAPPPEP